MTTPKLYRKDRSILEMRQNDPDRQAVRERLARLRATLPALGLPEYRARIVRKACDDVVEPPAGEDGFGLQGHMLQEITRVEDRDLPRYVFYRYRYEVFPRQRRLDDFPPCLQVEPASICNYRCVFCYQTDGEFTRPRNGYMGFMSLELFKEVVDHAEGAIEAVTLASRGEPLMNPDIGAMLRYAGGKFLALKLNTNAWFLDEAKCHAILEAGVNTVVFSADAATEPLYSQLRVRGRLDRVLSNIRRFQRIRTTHYPESMTITRVSGVRYTDAQNLDEMERVWGDLVDQVVFVDYNPWENTYEKAPNDVCTPCSDLWRRMFVWFDGVVNPCDVDYKSTLAVGDVRTAGLSEIWTGPKYADLRAAHSGGRRSVASPCNRCTFV